MPFQKVVNPYQAPAVAGDFASTNPNASMLAGEGALVAGDAGVTVGVFAWADADGKVSNKKATNGRIGFVHREQQASITGFLDEQGNTILKGQAMTLMTGGDFWAHFPAGAVIGQNVFAKDTDGTLKSSAAATEAGYTLTKFKVASTAGAGELAKITSWE
jgi:hypothetical protein